MDTGENGGKEGCVWVGFLVEEEQKGLFLSQSPFFFSRFFCRKKEKPFLVGLKMRRRDGG